MLGRLFKKKSPHPHIHQYILNHFGFAPRNTDVYVQALRHSSAATKEGNGLKNSNERLEFLGDAILDSVLAAYLYNKYPHKSEGDLTKMKAKVVSRRNLNAMGRKIELPKMMELNLGGQQVHQSIIGNAFEALIGAIYLDQGYDKTEKVLLPLLEKNGLRSKLVADVDFKSKLHEWCQKEKKSLGFRVVLEEQVGGTSRYVMAVLIDGKDFGHGEGKSKKSAEQLAAKQACITIFGD